MTTEELLDAYAGALAEAGEKLVALMGEGPKDLPHEVKEQIEMFGLMLADTGDLIMDYLEGKERK